MKNTSYKSALLSIEREREAVENALSRISEKDFGRAVDLLANCPRIMTSASGSSGIAAKKFAHSLCCIERGAMFMPPCEAVHGGMGGIKREDVMVMVSRGGKTSELLPLIDVVTKKGASLIAVTENPDSPLAKAASVVLLMNVGKESDPLGLMATSSYVQTIAIFDALLAALIEETGYTAEQFGLIHPGGAVGEHINGKTI
ncbi:MAG: SIS domain-containing protein [Clostridia bacterium]|nr:SIS domain-containing protein [Clostridia bacterium]